jgi:hypothetical protein
MQHESGRVGFRLSNFGSSRVSGRSCSDQVGFRVNLSRIISGFGSFGFGLGWVSDCLISGHLRFPGRSGSDQIRFWVVWSRVISSFMSFRSWSSSDQFDFLKKSNRIDFESERIGRVSQFGPDFITSHIHRIPSADKHWNSLYILYYVS